MGTAAGAASTRRWTAIAVLVPVIIAIVLVGVAFVAQSIRGGDGAGQVDWPLTIRYRVWSTTADDEIVADEVHELHGTSWRDWTDVTLTSAENAQQVGLVKRYSGDTFSSGYLTPPPSYQADTYLAPEVYDDYPGNASMIDRSKSDLQAPHPLMQMLLGRRPTTQKPHFAVSNGNEAMRNNAAARLGQAPSALEAVTLRLANCEAGVLEECAAKGKVVVRDYVYLPRPQLPLEVGVTFPDGAQDHMEVLSLRSDG